MSCAETQERGRGFTRWPAEGPGLEAGGWRRPRGPQVARGDPAPTFDSAARDAWTFNGRLTGRRTVGSSHTPRRIHMPSRRSSTLHTFESFRESSPSTTRGCAGSPPLHRTVLAPRRARRTEHAMHLGSGSWTGLEQGNYHEAISPSVFVLCGRNLHLNCSLTSGRNLGVTGGQPAPSPAERPPGWPGVHQEQGGLITLHGPGDD
ncbi:hypothetical protein Mp_8g01630 [Marchantia polymorpha subsp. ruderalis]|uniref:Uncharacterized protein n=1 Tax=Marchantia polymorpha TaxID=3197 RepID=A0A2R6WR68_MARPO|nr:hypothetical protein MARPO_0064s0036 [Marchantia polymorpha]BBN18323.1 hypothetical protein Mp_8g01630 [Marchantia polymorpha subsp. ruderalis]|eukprot:PTQ36349.1 hypothetical protein MARPO_0064s0036 [Marchantia polymorpha]